MTPSPINRAVFEEGTEITVASEVDAALTGWTLDYCSVVRVGSLVAVHIELAFGDAAAAHALTLSDLFAPGDTVTTADGKFTIGADGQVAFTGATTSGARVVCEAVYQAGVRVP